MGIMCVVGGDEHWGWKTKPSSNNSKVIQQH